MYYYKNINQYNISYEIIFENKKINYDEFLIYLKKINTSNIDNYNIKCDFIKKIEIKYIFDLEKNNFILQYLENNLKKNDSILIHIEDNDKSFDIINNFMNNNKILSFHFIENDILNTLIKISFYSNIGIYLDLSFNTPKKGFIIEIKCCDFISIIILLNQHKLNANTLGITDNNKITILKNNNIIYDNELQNIKNISYDQLH